MTGKTIVLGADHGGYAVKSKLISHLSSRGCRVIDAGAVGTTSTDYPIYGVRVGETVARGQADLGVLICRSGNGMAMIANKVPGVRAAIATNVELARLARQHNDANVLVIGADFLKDDCEAITDAFIGTPAEDGRHARRVAMIDHYAGRLESPLPTERLALYGQSVWLDDISDTLIKSGRLADLVRRGVRGVTSNPSIFEKAINSGEGRYKEELARLKADGRTPEEAYEILTCDDIRAAADILRPVYDETGGDDGYVSLEVLPEYAYDEEKSFEEAVRLFGLLDRPNVMIKIPGTDEGIRAFERATAEGVNVNVTLIFSRGYYGRIARAYIAGLTARRKKGLDVTGVRSVASVFISRIDGAVDKLLAEAAASPDGMKSALAGGVLHKAAIANTRRIYRDFRELYYGPDFAELAAAGAAPQRPLWGSTSTKDPSLPDTLYVTELVGPLTVNTIPAATLDALFDHGIVRPGSLLEDPEGTDATLRALDELGIDLDKVCDDLQSAGVKAFAESFDKLFVAIKSAMA